MRGKDTNMFQLTSYGRITPAYAGKRNNVNRRYEVRQDHPRVCGEKLIILITILLIIGSPPRVRGKEDGRKRHKLLRGITPACAGKRIEGVGLYEDNKDHPRVCGEKYCLLVLHIGSIGSPPRMRGKVRNIEVEAGGSRITPAYAGKRLCLVD